MGNLLIGGEIKTHRSKHDNAAHFGLKFRIKDRENDLISKNVRD
jgi:hypothetical protein